VPPRRRPGGPTALYLTGQMANGGGRSAGKTWRFVATPTVEGSQAVLRLEGRLGHHGAALLKASCDRLLAQGIDRVALDLSAVDYMSSAGVRTIDELAAALEARSGRLRLLNPTEPVKLVLDLSDLTERLTKDE
jgi:anti-anti-sigma factor